MGRLPTPVISKVIVEPDEDTKDRQEVFYQMIALAVVKAAKKGTSQ